MMSNSNQSADPGDACHSSQRSHSAPQDCWGVAGLRCLLLLGPYSSTYCLSGHGCVQGDQWTQGHNYSASENCWSTVGNGETEPSDEIRNRNTTSKRQVMVRVWRNSRNECNVLNYDNRGWVNTSAWADDAPLMKGAGDTTGCSWNSFLSNPDLANAPAFTLPTQPPIARSSEAR